MACWSILYFKKAGQWVRKKSNQPAKINELKLINVSLYNVLMLRDTVETYTKTLKRNTSETQNISETHSNDGAQSNNSLSHIYIFFSSLWAISESICKMKYNFQCMHRFCEIPLALCRNERNPRTDCWVNRIPVITFLLRN